MFSVIISEKGGAERRESYDRPDITIGRVQDNDLVLPKGNVSKRHARVRYREGGFIVTDLGSTNGTYVNGRKIPQATIVREGDKIYIGDFVLRIEAGGAPKPVSSPAPAAGLEEAAAPQPGAVPPPRPSFHSVPDEGIPARATPDEPIAAKATPEEAPPQAGARPRLPGPVPVPAIAPPPFAEPPSSSSNPSSAAERGLRPPSPRIEPKSGDEASSPHRPVRSDRHEVISHFPLEHDPDESLHVSVPAPPRVPSSPKPTTPPGINTPPGMKTLPVPGAAAPAQQTGLRPGAPTAPGTAVQIPQPSSGAAASAPSVIPATPASPQALPPSHFPIDRATTPSLGLTGLGVLLPGRRSPSDAAVHAVVPSGPTGRSDPAHAAALTALVERALSAVDAGALADGATPDAALLARIERGLADAVPSVQASGGAGLSVDAILVEARREIVELGPLGPLLDDDDVTEIHVFRHHHVVALHGHRQVIEDVGFTSEAALGRAIRRLCRAAGAPLAAGEVFVDRRLARGARLFAVMPRAEDPAHALSIRKLQRANLGLEELVRSGTISRAMAGFFTQCVAARANILVAGPLGAGSTTLLGALAGAGGTDDRVVALQEDDEIVFTQPHTLSLPLGATAQEAARAAQAAARLAPDQLVVGAFAGAAAAELVDAMSAGTDGVIAAARAPTLRQAVLRLGADLAAARPGLSPEVAREQLAGAFDVAIEVARLRDGRHRVLRVAEIGVEGGKAALRDIFTFTVERTAAGGAIEGSFAPTGLVPAVFDDLAARGVPVDPSLFRRHGKTEAGEGRGEPGQAQAGSSIAPSPRPGR